MASAGLFAALLLLAGMASQARADFGIAGFDGHISNEDGSAYTQAGGHPYIAVTEFDINSIDDPVFPPGNGLLIPDGTLKDAIVDLPAGFAGNPSAFPRCTAAQLVASQADALCPADSQMGILTTTIEFWMLAQGHPSAAFGLYNMVPPENVLARFGANIGGTPVTLDIEVRTTGDYGITASVRNTPQALRLTGSGVSLWGVPADPTHDAQRCPSMGPGTPVLEKPCPDAPGDLNGPKPSGLPPVPFLTNPTRCTEPGVGLESTLTVNSWEDPSDVHTASFFSHLPAPDEATQQGPTGCESVPFNPDISVEPTSDEADSPTGLEVEISVPQQGLENPDGIASAHLKDVEVTLPDGMAVNPSSANGLDSCSPAEIDLDSGDPDNCPDASKIGTVEIDTPLLDEPLDGAVYLAEQDNNPFNSTLAMYIVAEGPGIVLKLPGEVSTDEQTGQVTTTFEDNPQLPFTTMQLRLKGGSRAPLVTPATCGTKTATAEFSPWSAADPDNPTPDELVVKDDSFEITSGPNSEPCVENLADRPFNPTMNSGVKNPVAGSFTPFVFQLKRDDGDQELLTAEVSPPEGVTAKLAGVPRCNEAQISIGKCPEKSRVGTEIAAAGAGPSPFFVAPENWGKVYMAGPYDPDGAGPAPDAPLSMVIHEPVIAGPFDLDDVIIRAAVYVDPRTAQLTVVSDEIPQINSGIPLRIREIRMRIDRPGFTIAPTDCSEKSVEATITGSHGATKQLANRFQVGDCGNLGFDPSLKFTATGGKKATKRNQHPGLKANLKIDQPAPFTGQTSSNISQVEVTLPKQLLLDQSSPAFTDVCTRPEYDAGNCPASSKVGTATAKSPLLNQPLSGPVYLKTSDNQLPDLAADLNGIIDIDLFGRIDQDDSRIRNTFDIVPDVPVSSFELKLKGGADGVLVNANAGKGLCTSPKRRKINVSMSAHNDATKSYSTMFKAKCGKKKGKKNGKR